MSESRLQAVLWDLDGVIADTADYHYRAWVDIFGKRGVKFKREDFMHLFGQRHDTIIKFGLGDNISPEEFDTITRKKQEDYRRRVTDNIRPLPGAIELIKSLKGHRVKSAIASSAPQENIDIIIRGLGIEDCFDTIVCGMEVTEGKPSPQIFLMAAKKLGVRAGNCAVIEDAIAGVAAAKEAGMKCVAVTNSHPRNSLKKADLIVDTLETVTVADLTGLFRPNMAV
jgi:beta-phosphoglucomutase family hydrolase